MALEFDHLVIGAEDLDQGAEWAVETFGASPPLGGRHPLMGTHNRLASLPSGYVEIIARDPRARPRRRRWYGMDEPSTRARLAERPRPIAWVLATDDLAQALSAAPWPAGEPVTVGRDDLTWRMAVPPDGAVVDGVLPTFIEWPESLGRRAPRGRMAPLGAEGAPMALGALKLRHPEPDRIERMLGAVEAEALALAAGFSLSVARGETPSIEAAFRPIRMDRSL